MQKRKKNGLEYFSLKKKASSGAIIWGVIFCINVCLQAGKLVIKKSPNITYTKI